MPGLTRGHPLSARQDGDRYLLNGTKTWITNGIQGNCLAVLTKTDPAAEPHRGASLFLCVRPDSRWARSLRNRAIERSQRRIDIRRSAFRTT